MLLLINPGGDLGVDYFVAGDLGAVALDDLVRDVCAVFFEPFRVRFLAFNRGQQGAVIGQGGAVEGVDQGVHIGCWWWCWVIEGREWEGFGGYLIEISFQLAL